MKVIFVEKSISKDSKKIVLCDKRRFKFSNIYGKEQFEIENEFKTQIIWGINSEILIGKNQNLPKGLNKIINPLIDKLYQHHSGTWIKPHSYFSWCQHEFASLTKTAPNFNFSMEFVRYTMILYDEKKPLFQDFYLSSCVVMDKNNPFHFCSKTNISLYDAIKPRVISYFQLYEYRNFDTNMSAIFSHKVLSGIIKYYILNFYADYIYSQNSKFKKEDIGKSVTSEKVSIYAIPYTGVCFDGEGNRFIRNILLKNGILKGLVSNNKYAHALKLPYLGNSNMDDHTRLDHQRIICVFSHATKSLDSSSLQIEDLHQIYYNVQSNQIHATVRYQNKQKIYLAKIYFDIDTFFSNANGVGEKIWYEHTLCSDLFFDNCGFIYFENE